MSDETWAFRAENLSHRYPDDTPALRALTAEIPAGRTTAILGPSGCGKSTLLSLLGLLWDAGGTTGSLRYRPEGRPGAGELDLLALRPGARAGLRAASFGFVLQSNYLLPAFTCLQNVAMPLALHGWPARARERWAAELIGAADALGADLGENRGKLPRRVSAGQRQRYAVLRALITEPVVVFADEPSSNLDPGNTEAMFNLLASWRGGGFPDVLRPAFEQMPEARGVARRRAAPVTPTRTLVVVCHDLRTAFQRADHFLLMRAGTPVAAFTRADWDANAGTVEQVLGLNAGGASAERLGHPARRAHTKEATV